MIFGKLRKVRDFSMPTRYWDEEKEMKEHRERRIRAEMGLKNEDKKYIVPNLRGSFRTRGSGGFRKEMEIQRRKSLIRLIIIIVVLITLTYLYFGQDFILDVFKK